MSKRIKPFLILAVGLALAYFFVRRLDWEQVSLHLRGARVWPLLLGAVLINLTLLARSLRWRALLAPIAPVTLGHVFAATSIGFGSVFIVGRAGEIVRPMVLSLRERLRASATIATILIERLYDTTAVVGLFAVNLLFLRLPAASGAEPQTLGSIRTLGLLLSVGVAAGIAAMVLLRLRAEGLISWLERRTRRLPPQLVRPILNLIRHLADGLSVLLDLRELLLTSAYTALVWGLVILSHWLVFSAFNLDFSLSEVIFVLGFGLVGSVVPTPGGSAGAYHAAAAAGLIFLGLERNLAASVAIVLHLVSFGPPFLLGLYFLVRDGVGIGQLREMVAHERAGEQPPNGRGQQSQPIV